MVDPAGIEPATWRVTACSSIGIRHARLETLPETPAAGLPPGAYSVMASICSTQ